ncbi:MAG: aminomethyltransferase family protein, partial [Gammaproteobacteria bacterium]|nr:aminomethyltransferase family protein [Gammaproteobacteria bacterium]
VGELGWELYVPVDMAPGLYDTLMAAGAAFGLINAGTHALTSLRIEKGYRAWGHEVTPDDSPLEAGLAFATKLRSGVPFVGREALLEQQTSGLRRRLLHFKLDDPDVFIMGDEPILFDGGVAGQATSAAFGHSLGASVGMGYVSLEGRRPATMIEAGGFEIECAAERYPISVSLSAFFDPGAKRMRANP